MSDLIVEITRLDVIKKDNYYVVIQLDEEEFSSKIKLNKIKNRTEIEENSVSPKFEKNKFIFENFHILEMENFENSQENRTIDYTLRIGLYSSKITEKICKSKNVSLSENSTLLGINNVKFEIEIIKELITKNSIETTLRLLSIEKFDFEVGKIYLKIKYRVKDKITAEKFDLENLKSVLYNPSEIEPDLIKKKINDVIVLNENKQKFLNTLNKQLDETDKKYNLTQLDKLKLGKEKEDLFFINKMLKKEILKFTNYSELPIELDLLIDSKQGCEIIKKKLSVLINQNLSEKNKWNSIKKEVEETIPDLFKVNFLKNKFDVLKNANSELNFHINRYSDMMPLIITYKDQNESNKKLIYNIEQNIINFSNRGNIVNDKRFVEDINILINKHNLEKKILLEKKQQLEIFNNLFNKEISDFEQNKFYENRMNSDKNQNSNYILEMKNNIYNFSSAKNQFEKNLFFQMRESEKSKNLKKIIGKDGYLENLINQNEENFIENYKNIIKQLNQKAYELYSKIKKDEIEENNNNDFSIYENYSINSSNKTENADIDNRKEFLINEIEIMEIKEKVLLEELNYSYNYFETQIKALRDQLE